MDAVRARALPAADETPGELVRRTRKKRGLTLAQLGKLTGYSTAQVSRYERGVSPLTDTVVLRRFADALDIPPQALGLTPQPDVRHGHAVGPTTAYPRLPGPRLAGTAREDGEDPMRRRQLLANLALTAATAASAPLASASGPAVHEAAGDPSGALAAARDVAPGSLPSTERRARYYTDTAAAFGRRGRRDECIRALLAAEHHAPEETHARPAVKSLVSGLLVSGRTTAELRGLAARVGVLT